MSTSPIYVVSGGEGASGQQLVRTVLAQFRDADAQVIVVPHVRQIEQIVEVVTQAQTTNGIIVHTLVDAQLRGALNDLAREHNLAAIDLFGPLMFQLTGLLGQKPLEQPGQYRRLREDYFRRIEAIEFTVDHDDGLKPDGLRYADIVLIGVSRVGKTPLSMYLSTRGWKVANVPLIPQIAPPPQLFKIERRRVIGLTIKLDQLAAYRRRRQQHMGLEGSAAYSDISEIEAELIYAQRVFHQGGFTVIDITDKPIEESADEIVAQISRRL